MMDTSDYNNNDLASGVRVRLDHSYAKGLSRNEYEESIRTDAVRNEVVEEESTRIEDEEDLSIGIDDVGQNDTNVNDDPDLLKIGRTFKSMEELVNFVNQYMEKSKTAFVRKSCNQTQVSLILI